MVVEGAGPGARLPGSRPGSSSSWVAPGTRDLPLWTSPAPPLSSDGDRIEWDSCSCPLRALTSSHLSGCCLWLWPHTWAILSRPGEDQQYNTRQLFVGPAQRGPWAPGLSKKTQPSGCHRPLSNTVACVYRALCQGPGSSPPVLLQPSLSSHRTPALHT